MQQIIFFFIRNKNFLLFSVLFILSLFLTIQSHSYHQRKFVHSANFISGGIYSIKNDISNYFKLREQNNILINENARLRKLIATNENVDIITELDTTNVPSNYRIETARVINNSYAKTKNRITLNKGQKGKLKIDMGVITSKGIVGIVDNVSENYATVQSILNTNSQINAKLKSSNHFGSLVWNTNDPNIVQLIDIPRLAPINVGDTITTGGRSTIFPKGILIGSITDFSIDEDDNYFKLNIRLFNDMTNLSHVYIIENTKAEEIKLLEMGQDDEK